MRASHRGRLLAWALALLLVLSACGTGDEADDVTVGDPDDPTQEPEPDDPGDEPAPDPAEEIEPATVRMVLGTGIPDVHAVELYVAQDQGWFDAANIEVDEVVMDGSVAAMGALAAGQGNMSVLLAAGLPGVHLAGEDIVAFYHSGYSPLFVLVFPAGGRVQSFDDYRGLEDATLGVPSPGSAGVPVGMFGIRDAGLDLEDVELVPIGFGAEAVSNLAAGRVDAAIWTLWNLPLLEEVGFDYGYAEFEPLRNNWVGQIMATSPAGLEDDRETLVRFAQVWTHTRQYCFEDVEGCADAFIRATGDENPREVVIEQVRLRNTIMEPPPEADGRFGYTERRYWETLVEVQLAADWIDGEPDIDAMFTTELIDAVNEPPPGID